MVIDRIGINPKRQQDSNDSPETDQPVTEPDGTETESPQTVTPKITSVTYKTTATTQSSQNIVQQTTSATTQSSQNIVQRTTTEFHVGKPNRDVTRPHGSPRTPLPLPKSVVREAAGSAVGSIAFLAIVIMIIVFCYMRKQKRKKKNTRHFQRELSTHEFTGPMKMVDNVCHRAEMVNNFAYIPDQEETSTKAHAPYLDILEDEAGYQRLPSMEGEYQEIEAKLSQPVHTSAPDTTTEAPYQELPNVEGEYLGFEDRSHQHMYEPVAAAKPLAKLRMPESSAAPDDSRYTPVPTNVLMNIAQEQDGNEFPDYDMPTSADAHVAAGATQMNIGPNPAGNGRPDSDNNQIVDKPIIMPKPQLNIPLDQDGKDKLVGDMYTEVDKSVAQRNISVDYEDTANLRLAPVSTDKAGTKTNPVQEQNRLSDTPGTAMVEGKILNTGLDRPENLRYTPIPTAQFKGHRPLVQTRSGF